ncbi:MAG: hypothetical protein HF973_10400 [Chloroflexi bacterium]|nr:hypothetical protein [Chloroflexota bacterium]
MTTLNSARTSTQLRLRPSWWLAVILFLLATAGLPLMGWLVQLGCDPYSINQASTRLISGIISSLSFAILGTLIFLYRPENRIGWLSLGIAFALSASSTIDLYVACGLEGIIAAPGQGMAAWILYSHGMLFVFPIVILLPMLFPTGRFLSPRWRWAMVACLIGLLVTGTLLGLSPDFTTAFFYNFPMANPFRLSGLPSWWPRFFDDARQWFFIALRLLAIASIIVRFKRSVGDERQQIKWLAYFLAMTFGIAVFLFNIPATIFGLDTYGTIWFDLIIGLAFVGIPFVIGIAIFKYRLYAIDLIINRTLVYGGMTLLVVLLYSLIVVGSSRLFQTLNSLPSSLLATGLIAVLFQPARERLQKGVNRLMFGKRDNPYAVLSYLSQQLQGTAVPSETLTAIVQTIADTLKLPYVAIELTEQAAQVGQAFVGMPVGETVELPLHYQKERVGRLLVSPRAANERFTPQETQLLADIAAQTAPVASATRLTMALQRSREKLVLTREEERRRIRRDLHDGFGPTMASQTLKLDTVLELLLEDDPQAAVKYVQQLKGQTQQMVADIRQLVYELYPSVLDELGLLEALRIHVAQMRGVNGNLTVSIEAAPDPLPPLPAAIEVAAYRIVLEAVTNVMRHAQAVRCVVLLAVDNGRFTLTVSDDGIGLPATFQRGVGLTSMRERAEELGGSCAIGLHGEKGTRVTAVLPFQPPGGSKPPGG